MVNNKKKKKVKKQRTYNVTKLCTICGKPMKKKGQLCGSCSLIRGKARLIIKSKYNELTQYQLDYITKYIVHSYEPKVVLAWISQHPYDFWTFIPQKSHKERMNYRKQLREISKDRQNDNKPLNKSEHDIDSFPYLKTEFNKSYNQKYKLMAVYGTYTKPKVFIQCLKCKQDFICLFDEFKNGNFTHNCPTSTSSGEIIIGEYLKNRNINFITQMKTLKCINTITHYQLPYDFELTDYKIIIEVQGEQHFKFIPYFHQTEKNFSYQLWKDNLKKNYAEKRNYIFLAISYPEIKNHVYQKIIQHAINLRTSTKR
ncbi:hypothetical protein FD03_GL001862 [Companilactobacillus nodensis DSM 19682 = JCM 14932 = NBRC 107160]|uniref:DUF559 domain-containing protein n=2 Tax=Companilactobacillus nodensis TaxID=460870 RepID=A0A0R1KHN9_9LACO|nr:hypothetical protein FD03_GL001862 [Companilactobacillus nodensis DSM 19682 = JCM 14932 = NBRC 107160]